MQCRHKIALRAVTATIAVTSILWAGLLLARSAGRFGEALTSDGCECHNASPNANGAVTVTITGLQTVAPSSTNDYVIAVSGGPGGTSGGFNLKAQDGTLIAGPNVQVGGTPAGTEITHSSANGRTWNFQWTAPASEGTVEFYAVAQSCNGSGTGGDSWNFYGDAVGAPFAINVTTPVGVGDAGGPVLSLSPSFPNPFHSSTRIGFSLAKPGPARLEVYDLNGRRVTTLADGHHEAGTHEVLWDGRTSRGRVANAGIYWIRLSSEEQVLSTRVVRSSR